MKIKSVLFLMILVVNAFAEENQFFKENPLTSIVGSLEGAVQTRNGDGIMDMYLVTRDLNNDKICDRLEYWLLEKNMLLCRIDYTKMGEYCLELRYSEQFGIQGHYTGKNKAIVRFINNKLVTVDQKGSVIQEIELGIDRVYFKP